MTLNATHLVGFGGKAKTGSYYSASYLGKLSDNRYVSINGADVFVLDAAFNLIFKKTLTGCIISHYDGESILHGWRAGSASEKFVFSKLTIGSSDITVDAQNEVYLPGVYDPTTARGAMHRTPSYIFFVATEYALEQANKWWFIRCPIADMATRLVKAHTMNAESVGDRLITPVGDDLIFATRSRYHYTQQQINIERLNGSATSYFSRIDGTNYLFPLAQAAWFDGTNYFYCGNMQHVPTGWYVAKLGADNITHTWARQLPANAVYLGLWEDPDNSAYLYVATSAKLFKIAKSDGSVVQGYDAGQTYQKMVKKSARPYILNDKIFVPAVQHNFRNGSYSSKLIPNSDTLATITAPPAFTAGGNNFSTETPTFSASALTTVDACSATPPIIYRV